VPTNITQALDLRFSRGFQDNFLTLLIAEADGTTRGKRRQQSASRFRATLCLHNRYARGWWLAVQFGCSGLEIVERKRAEQRRNVYVKRRRDTSADGKRGARKADDCLASRYRRLEVCSRFGWWAVGDEQDREVRSSSTGEN